MPALNPRLNARCFSSRESIQAESARHPTFAPDQASALNLALEGLTEAEQASLATVSHSEGLTICQTGSRAWLSGTQHHLHSLCQSLSSLEEPLTAECVATLTAFTTVLEDPQPTLVMGILNVTPDSFSDGGQWLDADAAVAHALQMVDDGATVLDLGGESTRPGAEEIPPDEELRRVLPVLRALRPRTQAILSIDTRKAAVAEACLEEGANWINDVSGLCYDPALARVVARYPEAKLVLMHSRANPNRERYSTEYGSCDSPAYEDLVVDTLRWLRERVQFAMSQGVAAEAIWIDPGFGFGKSFEQNVELLRRLREYTSAGLPVLVGTSRKSSVGRLGGDLPPGERLEATAATVAHSIANGAAAVRVHDVKEMARVARVADALK